MLIMNKGKMIVVAHPPKLPNASEAEKKIITAHPKPKPALNIDKKPI